MRRHQPIKIGLVGAGYWGSKHLRVFNEVRDCELTGLCDASPETIARLPGYQLPEFVTHDFDELLASNIDAVVIATPARTHYPLAMKALKAGKHVMTEKPFTTKASDALELINEADRQGLTIMVGHTYVYHPAVRMLKDILESGHLGPIHYIHMARLNFGLLQPDVDVLWDLAPHDLSILMYLLDQEPLVAAARGTARVNPELCEVAHVDLEFVHALFAHIHVSWLEPVKVRRVTLVGADATAVYDDVSPGEMIRLYNKSIKLMPVMGKDYHAPTYLHGDVNIPLVPEEEPLKAECMHFLECIRTGDRPRSDGWEGLRVVRILETVAKSLYNGGNMESLSPGILEGISSAKMIASKDWVLR